MDYKVMTRRCKGPAFPAEECCSAFKEFACPYVNQINDMNSDCAKTMFSYLNIYGNYPPGLFANECKETKVGLICHSPPLNSPNASNAADSTTPRFITLLISTVLAFLVLALITDEATREFVTADDEECIRDCIRKLLNRSSAEKMKN